MRPISSLLRNKNVLLRVFIELIILLGIALRILTFFHNRNLIIDEANIVRNLAERDFIGLVKPLNYEQYAPPVFLWIEKLASLLFGYGEKAMRLYSFLCGVGTLLLFPSIAQRFMRREALWLPLAYLAGGFMFVKYSAEVKQYMPDTFIALLLVWLALRWDIRSFSRSRFIIYWIVAGSIAVWSSMPSVFILAGVGCYYGWTALREKRWQDFLPVCIIALVWIAQFALYYFTILKSQIGSSYLQNYHQEYFLFATPANRAEWLHNWARIEDIVGNVGGWSGVAVATNLLFLVVGLIHLLWKRTAQFMLIALPIGWVLIAAALNQFSLIDRVVLFMLPLWLLIVGVGFQVLWNLKLPVRALLVIVGGFNAWSYFDLQLIQHPFEDHQITDGMAWVKDHGARGAQLYVHHASVPTYRYYTELHPAKAQWATLTNAHLLKWDDNYADITRNIRDTAYFLYTGGFAGVERDMRLTQLAQHMQQIGYFEHAICYVYEYAPKAVQDSTATSSGLTPN